VSPNGVSQGELCDRLNAEGVKLPNGKAIVAANLKRDLALLDTTPAEFFRSHGWQCSGKQPRIKYHKVQQDAADTQ
jgi:hypothetical protein